MKISRDWSTPLTIGSFGLLAVTGVLMFFHLDTGLNKVVHEWLSWVLIAAVAFHVTSNLPAFKRYFTQARARMLIGGAAAVLALSFLPLGGGKSEPPFVAPVKALAAAPLPVLAQVAGVSPDEMRSRLSQAGVSGAGDQSVRERVGADTRRQVQVLGQVMRTPTAPAAPDSAPR